MASSGRTGLALLLNFSARINKLDCDRKASLNQHQTTSSGHRGGNKVKMRQVEKRHGLTQLLVESFTEIRRNRMRFFCLCWEKICWAVKPRAESSLSSAGKETWNNLSSKQPWRGSSGRHNVIRLRRWAKTLFCLLPMTWQIIVLVF